MNLIFVLASFLLTVKCNPLFYVDGLCTFDEDCPSDGVCHNGECLYPAVGKTSNQEDPADPEYLDDPEDPADPAYPDDPEDPDETVYPDEPEYPDGNRYRDTDSQLPNEGEEETEAPAAQEEESTTENHSEEDGQTGDDEETTVVTNESGEQSTTEVPPEEDYEDYTDKMPEGRAWTGTLLPPGPDDYYDWPRRSSR